MPMKMTPFGEQLREARLAAKLSTHQLASLAAIDSTYISRIEQGRRRHPSRPFVERLASILFTSGTLAEDQFYAAAGLLPPGGWHPTLTAVRVALQHPRMTPERRAIYLRGLAELTRVALAATPRPTPIGTYRPIHQRDLVEA